MSLSEVLWTSMTVITKLYTVLYIMRCYRRASGRGPAKSWLDETQCIEVWANLTMDPNFPAPIILAFTFLFVISRSFEQANNISKKAVLSQGNQVMPFLSVWCSPTFTTSLKVAKLRKSVFRALDIPEKKAEFNVKWSFRIIQGHVFWGQATRD